MKDFNLEDATSFRIHSNDWKKLSKVVKRNKAVYRNESHFIRCAILQLLRAYDKKGRGYRDKFKPAVEERPKTIHEIIKEDKDEGLKHEQVTNT